MVLTIRQAQILIYQFNNLNLNQPVQIASAVVSYVISPFEGNINHRYPQGLKIYLQEKKEIEKENEILYISVSNTKDIIYHFPSQDKKYGWGRLAFMVKTGAGAKNTLSQADHIQIVDMHHQSHE